MYVEFSSKNEDDLLTLDKLTTTVMMLGGTLQPSTRKALDKISPFLAKRVTGEHSLPIQLGIKKLFDPNLVLNNDGHIFYAKADNAKSMM